MESIKEMQWRKVGVVDQIYIYPLKSGHGLSFEKAKISNYGLTQDENCDRRFLIVDSLQNNKVITGRRYHSLVLLELFMIDKEYFTLNAPEMESLTSKIPPNNVNKISLDIFGNICYGIDCGNKVSVWIGRYLKLENPDRFRLIYHSDNTSSRSLIKAKNIMTPLSTTKDVPYFADGYPILLTTNQSVDELNHRLKEKGLDFSIDERRFRTNIHISNSIAFDEDNWAHIRIGENAFFHNCGPSPRCTFTTVNPMTAEKNDHGQPLNILRTFRVLSHIDKRSPCFGINLGIESSGSSISRGDPVFATYWENKNKD